MKKWIISFRGSSQELIIEADSRKEALDTYHTNHGMRLYPRSSYVKCRVKKEKGIPCSNMYEFDAIMLGTSLEFKIFDWAHNPIKPDMTFRTFEDAWAYIKGPLTEEIGLTEEDYQEYFVEEVPQ